MDDNKNKDLKTSSENWESFPDYASQERLHCPSCGGIFWIEVFIFLGSRRFMGSRAPHPDGTFKMVKCSNCSRIYAMSQEGLVVQS